MDRLGVLASGNGTNLEALIQASKEERFPFKVELVLSDKENAYARQRAINHGIKEYWINPNDYKQKKEFEQAMITQLEAHKVDWVILAGFMRILSQTFVNHFHKRILNIHPALLPAFPGLHAIDQAVAYGCKVTGVTVHFVDEGVDTGPIILQQAVSINPEESRDQLEERIHKIEHSLYPEAIKQVIEGRVQYSSRY